MKMRPCGKLIGTYPLECCPTQAYSGFIYPKEIAMKPVSELLKKHPSALFQAPPDITVFDGLKLLASYGVGAMVVMQQGKLVGIFSERDYTRKVALEGKNSREITIADIMTRNVVSVLPQTGTRECMSLMSKNKIRHLPVVDNGKVLGLISIRDIMDDIIADHEQTITHLQSYISG
jgi:CBS domain-containing protein